MFKPVEKRLHFRVPLYADILIDAEDDHGLPVELLDASLAGFALRCTQRLTPGTSVRLRCPGLPDLRAKVSRSAGDVVGCQFDRTLHPVHFQHLLMLAGRSGTRRLQAA